MAEFKIERFKYNWKGDWQTGFAYKRDDIVRNGGKSYVCIKPHTSSATFGEDIDAIVPGSSPPLPDPAWIIMTGAKTFKGDWQTATSYSIGDIVVIDGTTWYANANHVSTSFASDNSKWDAFIKNAAWRNDWTADTDYAHGALVKYNGIVYYCLTSHTSTSTLEADGEKWKVWYENVEYRGAYNNGTEYRKNDLVKYGGSVLRCNTTHTASSPDVNPDYFDLEFLGYQYDSTFSFGTVYNIGDVVQYGGYLYYATDNNYQVFPDDADSSNAWVLFAKTSTYRGMWIASSSYNPGDVVQRGGELYQALATVNNSIIDDFDDTQIWELLVPGKTWKEYWTSGNTYIKGEIVYHLGDAWVCTDPHIADATNFPGDNGSGFDYWDLLIQGGQPAGMTTRGDMLTYGLSREASGDGSSLGDVRLPIGNPTELLSITEEQEAFWRTFTYGADVVYVAMDGEDELGGDKGINPNKPFKTVRFACEFVEDTFDPLTPVTIRVATGQFPEIGPISIPAGCAVMGDELRSTTISAAGPDSRYVDDFQYQQDVKNIIEGILQPIITNNTATPANGNNIQQVIGTQSGTNEVANAAAEKMADWYQYLEYAINASGEEPAITGNHVQTSDEVYIYGANNLLANREWIANEVYAALNIIYPPFNEDDPSFFDLRKIKDDVYSIIRGLARDLKFTGNLFTLKAAKRYYGALIGSATTDLFYVRDTTGLRNCSIKGLTGGLNPPGVYDLYQRPTGGACVSLDPGYGPADESVWINNRSPYIQGVTNIGDRCVGKKVDGSLHNGGNKSMTSNDFTQVLSDGIGAWISNNGRAELVSVFTYYCQVGYFAENGGVIRATNGNNSYGSFGSVADGNDPTETPQSVTVNNRNNEATVEKAFAGGIDDRLFVFEYSHAGEQYSEATATIVGAGADAEVEFDDFRAGGLSNARLINTQGSGSEGGAGYLIRSGSAQITPDSTSSITLSLNDLTQFDYEILGMRLIITSGDGVGQYGYIQAYDNGTRVATIYRESDDQPGWDHVLPGTAIESSLDSTAVYRIEPRLSTNAPGFTATSGNLLNQRTIEDLTWDWTFVEYNGILLPTGTGETYDGDAIRATVNVQRRGPEYTISLAAGGAGYAVGDELVIEGTELGGVTPDNDLTVTINSVSDDSTNSILSLSATGTPRGKRYVAIAQPNFVLYSDDGQDYVEANTSFTGTYTKIISGFNRFVAVAANENRVSISFTGEGWNTRALPTTANWVDGAFGADRFVIIADDTNDVVYSSDSLNWSSTSIPDNTLGDSTVSQWQGVAYGQGRFVAIAGSDLATATSTDGVTWTRHDNALPAPSGMASSDYDFVSLAYGNNRFIALTKDGRTLYSIDGGETFVEGGILPNNGGSVGEWIDLKYGQGVFLAICYEEDLSGPIATNYTAVSEYGIIWNEKNLDATQKWAAMTCAVENGLPSWNILASDATTQGINTVVTGAQAKLRADVFQGKFANILIWDPGSGYDDSNPLVITVTDTQFTTEVETENNLGVGVLAQPGFVNRGAGYRTSTSTITLSGDGFAEIVPESTTLTLDGVSVVPGPGAQIRITGIEDDNTVDPDDLKLFTGIGVKDIGDDGSGNGTRTVEFTVTPRLRNENNLAHGTNATIRVRYSQCRITGHDFLDIGTGNFEETNYPDLYSGGNYFVSAPENEVSELNGGRIFYVSTDQDGNFRAGELFAVEQATGIVTISAEFFDLDGLSELALGGVRLGGSGAVVREFSTDPTFAEDSNNVVPTQRAIATFLADRLSVGGSDLETNTIQAGKVRIGTENNIIEMSTGEQLQVPRTVTFDGTDANGNPTQIQGSIIGQMLFARTLNETIQ